MIFKEAMNNCVKYADCKNVTFDVERVNGHLAASLKDDGKGFDIPGDVSSLTEDYHFGLAGLAERVELMSGRLSIRSQLTMGTEVLVVLPLV